MALTHDARVIAAKLAAAKQPVEDAVLLDRARVLVQTKMDRSQVTTELMYQHLDPTSAAGFHAREPRRRRESTNQTRSPGS